MTIPSSVLAPKVTPLPLSEVRRQLSIDFCYWCGIDEQQGVRGNWISRIQEYDLEIKPIKIIKGQGLAQLLTEQKVLVNFVEENHDDPSIEQ